MAKTDFKSLNINQFINQSLKFLQEKHKEQHNYRPICQWVRFIPEIYPLNIFDGLIYGYPLYKEEPDSSLVCVCGGYLILRHRACADPGIFVRGGGGGGGLY